MTPLPPPLGTGELVAWRLHRTRYRDDWDSGEGAFRWGGRWNSRGVRAVYCSLDPATAILEVAVHTGFPALDAGPHVMTAIRITDPTRVYVIRLGDAPDHEWLPLKPDCRTRLRFLRRRATAITVQLFLRKPLQKPCCTEPRAAAECYGDCSLR